ncbi:MAG: ring-cleaving dioxygenase, partial [Rhodothermaceae bacterium]|nr:ring-cleaving dioxygenase [Rhodothermaceae bacterium]
HKGRVGNGETSAVAYSIPKDSISYWRDRLTRMGVDIEKEASRFSEEVLVFNDAEGIQIELVGTDAPSTIQYWVEGPIPEEHALRGFHSVTLLLDAAGASAELLIDQMGYSFVGKEGNRYRYEAASNDRGLYIDIEERPGGQRGAFGAGSIHHIAFRTVDDDEQLEYRNVFIQSGRQVTPVRDRQYFHSIYFREPGGVLFEVATDAPGFLYDEPIDELGDTLKLPPWLEGQRDILEQKLPAIQRAHENKEV